ncbi:MAG TPA: cytochrome c [Saprospiraceae bacterium]|nr:cytochrome c [Saprospiraceae bacterium]
MNATKVLQVGVFTFLSILIATAFTPRHLGDPWVVPDKYKNMKNPVKADAESISAGKTLYNKHCKSCHGSKGLGDGTKAAQLKTKCGDFSSADFQSQSDGSIFYKTNEGRDDMPSFKKKIPEATDVWNVVNYLRTLKK